MSLAHRFQDIRTIKRLLTCAEAEADRAGDSIPGAEHLLLSALALPDGSARRAFERVGADPDGLRAAIDAAHASALRGIGVEPARVPLADADPRAPATGVLRTDASAQHAFRAAVELSKANRPRRLLGAHVVVAVCEMEHGTAARALDVLGTDRAALGAAAREEAT